MFVRIVFVLSSSNKIQTKCPKKIPNLYRLSPPTASLCPNPQHVGAGGHGNHLFLPVWATHPLTFVQYIPSSCITGTQQCIAYITGLCKLCTAYITGLCKLCTAFCLIGQGLFSTYLLIG